MEDEQTAQHLLDKRRAISRELRHLSAVRASGEYSSSREVELLKDKEARRAWKYLKEKNGDLGANFARIVGSMEGEPLKFGDIGDVFAAMNTSMTGTLLESEFVGWWSGLDAEHNKVGMSVRMRFVKRMMALSEVRVAAKSVCDAAAILNKYSFLLPDSGEDPRAIHEAVAMLSAAVKRDPMERSRSVSSALLRVPDPPSNSSSDLDDTDDESEPSGDDKVEAAYTIDPETPSLTVYWPYFDGYHGHEYCHATISALPIELILRRLLQPGHTDDELEKVFLTTYLWFLPSTDLTAMLIQRLHCHPIDRFDVHFHRVKSSIQLKVLDFIMCWARTVPASFLLEPATRAALGDELKQLVTEGHLPPEVAQRANEVRTAISRIQPVDGKHYDTRSMRDHIPAPLIPTASTISCILDISAVELARQLTLKDFDIFYRVQPHEFLKKAPRPNVDALTNRFNDLSAWAATEILRESVPAKRARILCHIVDTAYCCRVMDNFSSLMALISALESVAVSRLESAFKAMPRFLAKRLAEMQHLMDMRGSFRNYRDLLTTLPPPAVAFTGPIDHELITIDEKHPTYQSYNQMLNVGKFRRVHSLIHSMTRLKEGDYCIQPVPAVVAYIQHAPRWEREDLLSVSKQKMDEPTPQDFSYEADPMITALVKPVFDSTGATKMKARQSSTLPVAIIPDTPSAAWRSVKDLHPLEVARQLTLLDFDLFTKIDQADWIANAEKKEDCGACKVLLMWTERTTAWAIHEVLKAEDLEERAHVLCTLIDVAHACLVLNNFASLKAITLAISGVPACARLKHTFDIIPEVFREKLSLLEQLVSLSKGAQSYLDRVDRATPPCIPIIWLHVRKLRQLYAQFVEIERDEVLGPELNESVGLSKRSSIMRVHDAPNIMLNSGDSPPDTPRGGHHDDPTILQTLQQVRAQLSTKSPTTAGGGSGSHEDGSSNNTTARHSLLVPPSEDNSVPQTPSAGRRSPVPDAAPRADASAPLAKGTASEGKLEVSVPLSVANSLKTRIEKLRVKAAEKKADGRPSVKTSKIRRDFRKTLQLLEDMHAFGYKLARVDSIAAYVGKPASTFYGHDAQMEASLRLEPKGWTGPKSFGLRRNLKHHSQIDDKLDL